MSSQASSDRNRKRTTKTFHLLVLFLLHVGGKLVKARSGREVEDGPPPDLTPV